MLSCLIIEGYKRITEDLSCFPVDSSSLLDIRKPNGQRALCSHQRNTCITQHNKLQTTATKPSAIASMEMCLVKQQHILQQSPLLISPMEMCMVSSQ